MIITWVWRLKLMELFRMSLRSFPEDDRHKKGERTIAQLVSSFTEHLRFLIFKLNWTDLPQWAVNKRTRPGWSGTYQCRRNAGFLFLCVLIRTRLVRSGAKVSQLSTIVQWAEILAMLLGSAVNSQRWVDPLHRSDRSLQMTAHSTTGPRTAEFIR